MKMSSTDEKKIMNYIISPNKSPRSKNSLKNIIFFPFKMGKSIRFNHFYFKNGY